MNTKKKGPRPLRLLPALSSSNRGKKGEGEASRGQKAPPRNFERRLSFFGPPGFLPLDPRRPTSPLLTGTAHSSRGGPVFPRRRVKTENIFLAGTAGGRHRLTGHAFRSLLRTRPQVLSGGSERSPRGGGVVNRVPLGRLCDLF